MKTSIDIIRRTPFELCLLHEPLNHPNKAYLKNLHHYKHSHPPSDFSIQQPIELFRLTVNTDRL